MYVMYVPRLRVHIPHMCFSHEFVLIGVCRPAVSRQQSAPTLVFRCVLPDVKIRHFSCQLSHLFFNFSPACFSLCAFALPV